jgi:hypothetical protein
VPVAVGMVVEDQRVVVEGRHRAMVAEVEGNGGVGAGEESLAAPVSEWSSDVSIPNFTAALPESALFEVLRPRQPPMSRLAYRKTVKDGTSGQRGRSEIRIFPRATLPACRIG